MNHSIKRQFVTVLISVCIFTPVLVAKSGEYETKLKFEIDTKKSQLWLGSRPDKPGKGPVKPSYAAVLHIRKPHMDVLLDYNEILKILKTSAGQSLSQEQRKFLTASNAYTLWGTEEIKNHDTIFIYAVSREDVKKTVLAYLEIIVNEINSRAREYGKYIQEKKEEIVEIKNTLPEKQKQADQIEPKYMEIKNSRYFSLSDVGAYEKAEETMLEMDKMLDILEIDLAGIKVKLDAIGKYRSARRLPDKALSKAVLDKLDEMFVDQMIELKSAEARQQAVIKIRDRDKNFINMFNEWNNLKGQVFKLKANLESAEKMVKEGEEMLNNPHPAWTPPEIYQNKVTIYSVLIK